MSRFSPALSRLGGERPGARQSWGRGNEAAWGRHLAAGVAAPGPRSPLVPGAGRSPAAAGAGSEHNKELGRAEPG